MTDASGDEARLRTALEQAAVELTREGARRESREDTLDRIVRAATGVIPGAQYAGMTERRPDGTLVSHSPNNPTVVALDRLQVELGEGPCVDTVTPDTTTVITVDDFTTETRWPRFSPAAAARGVRSLCSYAIAPRTAPPAALNLYAATGHAFDALSRSIAAGFAAEAAVRLYSADEIDNLHQALASRDIIGQAKGLLMYRDQITAAQAFRLLVEASQNANVKLVDVAHWLISENTPGPGPDPAR